MTQHPKQPVWYYPVVRIFVGLIVCISVAVLLNFAIGKMLDLTALSPSVKRLINGIAVAALVVVIYYYLFKFYEQRRITELSAKKLGKHVLLGVLLGAGLQALTILVIYLKGGYTVISINPVSFILPPLAMAATSSILEEVIVRGIIFRIMEERLGSYISLIISAIIFGALHLANPNSSLLAGAALAIQAGVLLAAAFIYTRNLWFPIAIHFAWNFTQSAIFGAAVSGVKTSKSLVTSHIEGATWYTGGDFGPEGSLQATVFCFIVAVILLVLSAKKGRLIAPSRQKQIAAHH